MQARIFEYDAARLEGRCTHDGKVYRFKLSQNLGCAVGDLLEGEVINEPSLFADGELHAVSCESLNLDYGNMAVSRGIAIAGHETLSIIDSISLCAEGDDPQDCIDRMVKYLDNSYANALLNLTIEGRTKRLCRGVLWTVKATIAQIRGDRYDFESGRAITIKRNQARRNSPNKVSIRYIRVLLVCALFVLIPCLLSTAARGLLGPVIISQVISGLMVAGALYLGITYFPKAKRVYLLNLQSRR